MAVELLKMRRRPTAIVAANDQMAFGAIKAARELGLTIPQDLSVVGFDNTPLSSYFDPPLTTVEIPMYEIGSAAMTMLMDLLSGNPFDKYRSFNTKLLKRGSTTAPRD
jgi:DNA-binding LacI/PurR family transcriptional regulator